MTTTTAATTAATTAETNGTAAGDEKAAEIKLSKEEKAKLFEAYEKHDAEVKAAEAKVNTATAKRSEVVKLISEKVGKGPFKWKGEELSISKRGEKFFFRGRGTRELEDIG
jgi:nucleoid-associated protein YgaU